MSSIDTFIKDSIKEFAEEVAKYEATPFRMTLDSYVERTAKSIINSLIGTDESLIGVLSPEMNNDTIETINREADIRNAFRKELRERAGL